MLLIKAWKFYLWLQILFQGGWCSVAQRSCMRPMYATEHVNVHRQAPPEKDCVTMRYLRFITLTSNKKLRTIINSLLHNRSWCKNIWGIRLLSCRQHLRSGNSAYCIYTILEGLYGMRGAPRFLTGTIGAIRGRVTLGGIQFHINLPLTYPEAGANRPPGRFFF